MNELNPFFFRRINVPLDCQQPKSRRDVLHGIPELYYNMQLLLFLRSLQDV